VPATTSLPCLSGAEEPNAADFQILASVGVLRAFADLEHQLHGRPCDAAARRVYPRLAGDTERPARELGGSSETASETPGEGYA
jgi:hypothetical protein